MTPAQAATNQRALDKLAARLVGMGYSGDADAAAKQIAWELLADGYRRLEPPPALAGPTSTEEGRRRARELFEETRRAKEGAA